MRERIAELAPTEDAAAGVAELSRDELEERVMALEVETGQIFWKAWWVPEQLGRVADATYYSVTALGEGAKEPEACGPWLALLGKTIKKSAAVGFGNAARGKCRRPSLTAAPHPPARWLPRP